MQGSGFRVQGSGFRVQGSGLRTAATCAGNSRVSACLPPKQKTVHLIVACPSNRPARPSSRFETNSSDLSPSRHRVVQEHRHALQRPAGFRVQGVGFRVQGSGFRGEGSGFRVQGSGFRVQGSESRVQGSGFGVQSSEFRVQGSGFRVQGSEFRVQDSGFRVRGSGFRVRGAGFRALHCSDLLRQRTRYRGTSLMRNSALLGPCSRNMTRALWWS